MKKVTIKPNYVGLFDRPELIRFHYIDQYNLIREIYFTMKDFRDWIMENDFLTLDKGYYDLWSHAAPNSSMEITPDDFFSNVQFCSYLIQMARLFFSERVSIWAEPDSSDQPF